MILLLRSLISSDALGLKGNEPTLVLCERLNFYSISLMFKVSKLALVSSISVCGFMRLCSLDINFSLLFCRRYYCLSLLCRGNNGDGDHSVSTCCPVSQTCIVFIIYVFGLANNDNLSNPVD